MWMWSRFENRFRRFTARERVVLQNGLAYSIGYFKSLEDARAQAARQGRRLEGAPIDYNRIARELHEEVRQSWTESELMGG